MNYEEMNKQYGCTAENFVKNEEPNYSVCREERQYAVFLYNILCYYRRPERRCQQARDIFKACGLKDAIVEQVFYEATFMRDFFERNRRLVLGKGEEKKMPDILLQKSFTRKNKSMEEKAKDAFNYKLMEYVHKGKVEGWTDGDLRYNLGRYVPGAKLSEDEKFTIKCMMEAKPDIAVLYKKSNNDKKDYLLFLECKFESDESFYYSEKQNKMKQSRIQWKIADFLCKTYLKEEAEVSESMKGENSRLVRFVRKDGERPDEEIRISDLVNLNKNEIFHE